MAIETTIRAATAELAEFVAGTSWEQVPDAARVAGRRMLFDTAGVAIAGSVDPGFEPARRFAARALGQGSVPAPVERPVDVLGAALLAGTAAHLLDYDDVHPMMGGHPSAILFPVIYALGYELGISGKDAIRAMALGGEVEARIGNAINPAHYSVGWHPTAVIGTLGAAAAAAALLGLDAEATRRALGIAASHACGTKANFGTSVKSLHIGIAARSGIESTLLAEAGATANDRILDEQFGGFCELFSPATDRSQMVQDLGDAWYVADPGVAFKSLPCCGSTHASVWGMIQIAREHRPDPRRIRAIETGVDYRRMPHTDRPVVRTGLEGKFSTQYCVAVAALQGAVGLNDFDERAVAEPRRQELMRKVRYYAAPDADTWPDAVVSRTGSHGALVEVTLDDGTTYRQFQPDANPYPAIAPDDSDLELKFLDCAGRALAPDRARNLADQLMRLEAVGDIRPLVERTWAWG
jgi:2-methylcitrate dehydratase PrpD